MGRCPHSRVLPWTACEAPSPFYLLKCDVLSHEGPLCTGFYFDVRRGMYTYRTMPMCVQKNENGDSSEITQ